MDDETLTWTVRLAGDSPVKRTAILAVAILAGLIGWFGFGRPLFGVVGMAMILGSTADYWLGSRFTLDAKGATAKTGLSVTAMDWSEVRRVLVKGREVRLSPLALASGLDSFRGVGLVPTEENRAAVMAFIEAHVRQPDSATEEAA